MGKSLVLISHGELCEALKKGTEMIMGKQENIYAVPLLPSEGQEEYKEKFLQTIKPLNDFIVLADLMGGTPCNIVSKLILSGAAIELYVGMNMPMVISFINSELIDENADLVTEGQKNIFSVNAKLKEEPTEDDE
ncbi:PTS sugar transporter subunit IIA [Melissococcus plutonius]|uniref:Predicted PTS system, galactosamine-specific IIA component n=1 Tax=Melissococcus plutonius (strain ATCC 35311 / DSM 29964 / CIP 104052 / LMG 20360 / NCIMB 702443) TaxID=940190 RepID=F3Y8S0_MELPT|nr:PTS fructose transporter subunit IIA [Melissococcus plutonius]AIM24558.1 putative PTS system, galactosamine-specific IIA component [Melissococcus plutonius S1]KMT24626.1 putative PTS system, galactosamine-specific IIA component [Melissococcus plutonius]KMT27339.1 putative PTS system, galactosamine-specific IIA component [Melissococcus plutonius]KMT27512.1 putative PTS system, galactosamine-specific IIA component [Melissococcus plutonius]KMT29286.1 putative PTS system, galactosamine-specific